MRDCHATSRHASGVTRHPPPVLPTCYPPPMSKQLSSVLLHPSAPLRPAPLPSAPLRTAPLLSLQLPQCDLSAFACVDPGWRHSSTWSKPSRRPSGGLRSPISTSSTGTPLCTSRSNPRTSGKIAWRRRRAVTPAGKSRRGSRSRRTRAWGRHGAWLRSSSSTTCWPRQSWSGLTDAARHVIHRTLTLVYLLKHRASMVYLLNHRNLMTRRAISVSP